MITQFNIFESLTFENDLIKLIYDLTGEVSIYEYEDDEEGDYYLRMDEDDAFTCTDQILNLISKLDTNNELDEQKARWKITNLIMNTNIDESGIVLKEEAYDIAKEIFTYLNNKINNLEDKYNRYLNINKYNL